MKIISFKNENKNKLLTNEQQESYEKAKICYICQEKFDNKYLEDKNYCKVRDNYHYTGENRGASHSICDLKCNVPKKIPIVPHNGYNYDYQFIKKIQQKDLKHNLVVQEKDLKIYNIYSSNRKFTSIAKNGEEIIKNLSYMLQFIDSVRFLTSLLSNLVNNFSERIHRIKYKLKQDDKKCEIEYCGICGNVRN